MIKIKNNGPRTVVVSSNRWLIGHAAPASFAWAQSAGEQAARGNRKREGRVFLRDLGSTNGTLLNNRQIRDQEVELHHDDEIRLAPRWQSSS